MSSRIWAAAVLRYRKTAAAIGVASAIAATLAYGYVAGPRVELAAVTGRELVETVVASGRAATPYRVDIGSQIVGTVAEVPVEEGQAVRVGEPLVILESSEARAGLKQAQVAVAQAEARLRQLAELQLPVAAHGLRQAQANLTDAQAQYERTRNLFKEGFVSSAALDDAQRNLDVAQAQVDSARKQVETAQPAGSDYAMADKALEQAKAALLQARARYAYTVIRAPASGTLIARDVERGDVVQPGKVLMVLSPAGETQLVLQIDERNLSRLKLGQAALASADAYPTRRFVARLVYINPGVDAQRGTVEVKLTVPEPPDYLRQDMTVSVDIEVARHPGALTVPAAAVRDATGTSPWVLRVEGGRAQARPVKLGVRGEAGIEVREGLQAGDMVVATANVRVRPGQHVRGTGAHE